MFARSARGPSRKVTSEVIVETSIEETPSSSVILELATLESHTNSFLDGVADTEVTAFAMLSPNDSGESGESAHFSESGSASKLTVEEVIADAARYPWYH